MSIPPMDKYILHRGYRIGLLHVSNAIDLLLTTNKSHDEACELLKAACEKLNRIKQEIVSDY